MDHRAHREQPVPSPRDSARPNFEPGAKLPGKVDAVFENVDEALEALDAGLTRRRHNRWVRRDRRICKLTSTVF